MSKEYSNKQFWNEYWEKEQRHTEDFIFAELVDKFVNWNEIDSYMEIGGAPGSIMAYMHNRHGLEVSTIDFCSKEITDNYLKSRKINSYSIYEADFIQLDISDYKDKYDLVSSWGFIEHFDLDTCGKLIRKHKALVADGGYLIIELPNIRKFNWLLYRIFNKELLDIHNLDVMNLSFLKERITEGNDFKLLYSNYYLTSFLGFSSSNEFFERHRIIKWIFGKLQSLSRVLHIDNIKNRFFSPYIVMIAQKVK